MDEPPQLFVHSGLFARIAAMPARPWEVGGWLLGYWTGDETSVTVTHATPPSHGTPLFVRISGRKHRRRFDEAWNATDGGVTFLGDWHTHPGGAPLPSARDKRAIGQLASDSSYGTTPPLMVIASTPRWPRSAVRPTIVFYTLASGEPTALKATLFDELPPPANRVAEWRWPRRRINA